MPCLFSFSARFLTQRILIVGITLSAAATTLSTASAQEYLNGIRWDAPPIVKPGAQDAAPPSDAIVLFDGKDLSHWSNGERWSVADGVMVSGKGMVFSKEEFGDCQVHIEWSAPTPAKGTGQGRGNSGVFLMGRYELQVLDSYENETYFDGQAGAIYKQTPPMANVMRARGSGIVTTSSGRPPNLKKMVRLPLPPILPQCITES